jgi:hypothetical protein
MKKIVFLITLGLLVISCDVTPDETYSYEVSPVFEIVMPTAFKKDSITEIPVKYKRPSTCNLFNKFYYESEGFDRYIAIETLKVNQDNCQVDTQTIYEVPLKFKPVELGTYHLKFWTGPDAQGVDQYLTYDVVVDH